MKNPTGIELCILHKIATSRGPLLNVNVVIKTIIRISQKDNREQLGV